MASPLVLSLSRPATDNDRRDWNNGTRLWDKTGLNTITHKVTSIKQNKSKCTASSIIMNAKGGRVGALSLIYSLNNHGVLNIHAIFTPDTATVQSLPRVGLTFRMKDHFGEITYLGRGDIETYTDRKQAGKIDIYNTTAERMFHYYATQQSTGNRTDVRWSKITDETGKGIFIESNRPYQFSVIPFADELLDRATHINQLERDGNVTIHIDAEQSGVGTATCGPGVLKQHRVAVHPLSFEFTLYPLQ